MENVDKNFATCPGIPNAFIVLRHSKTVWNDKRLANNIHKLEVRAKKIDSDLSDIRLSNVISCDFCKNDCENKGMRTVY